jgi:hypothetical protein
MTIEQTIMAWAGAIIAVGGAIGVVYKLTSPIVKKTRRLIEALDLFTKDWFGDEGDDLHPRKPGMLERMSKVELELKHNGGSSIKDAVRRIEKKLTEIDTRLDEGALRFQQIEQKVEN